MLETSGVSVDWVVEFSRFWRRRAVSSSTLVTIFSKVALAFSCEFLAMTVPRTVAAARTVNRIGATKEPVSTPFSLAMATDTMLIMKAG